MAARKCRYLRKLKPVLYEKFDKIEAERIMEKAWEEYAQLCRENAGEPKAMHMHTRGRIYPAIAAFRAMSDEGVDRRKASDILCRYYEKQNEPTGSAIRVLLHIPGLYKLVPRFFAKMTGKVFGEAAGFQAKWFRADKEEMRFDMLVCPYWDICVRYGCPEIVCGFCRADDICYGNMHPKPHWGRTKTLGLGGDCCDFLLAIRRKKRLCLR